MPRPHGLYIHGEGRSSGLLLQRCLEAERHLQIESAIARQSGERAARNGIRLTKQRRAQIADRRGQIHVVEDVPRRNAERQVIAMVRAAGVRAAHAAPTPTWPTASPVAAGAAAKGSAGAGARDIRAWFLCLFAEAETLTNAQVQREPAGARQGIHGHKSLARLRNQVKRPESIGNHVRWDGSARSKRWTIVKYGIAINILSGRQRERDSRACNQERAETECIRQADRTADKNSMPYVERCAPVIETDIVEGRRKTPCTRSIAIGVVERVVAKERKF